MESWLVENGFKSLEPHAYYRRKIGVICLYGHCQIMYDNDLVWSGAVGQDAIGVIKEYLDL
jgi:hypothetical protein